MTVDPKRIKAGLDAGGDIYNPNEWLGSVRALVNRVAASAARQTFTDKSGAKIRINIDGLEGATEKDEPFYIEYGKNLYDAYNQKEAVMILSNIRKGKKDPDMPSVPKRRWVSYMAKLKKSGKRRPGSDTGIGSVR